MKEPSRRTLATCHRRQPPLLPKALGETVWRITFVPAPPLPPPPPAAGANTARQVAQVASALLGTQSLPAPAFCLL